MKKIIKHILQKIRHSLQDPPKDPVQKLREAGALIGSNVDILASFIDGIAPYLLSIGDNVTITHATILTHDASIKKFLGYTKIGSVHIGNNVFIGFGSIVLPGTRIGNDVIIGSGTVVARDVPDNVVVIGNPMQILCTCDAYLAKNKKYMSEKPVYDLMPGEVIDIENITKNIEKNMGGYIL